MKHRTGVAALVTCLLMGASAGSAQTAAPSPPDSQADLVPVLNGGGSELRFDWPALIS